MCAALGLSIFTSFPTTRLGTSGNNIQWVEKKSRINIVYSELRMVDGNEGNLDTGLRRYDLSN